MYQIMTFPDRPDVVLPGIRRIEDGACIPEDENNADWIEYQKWLEAGNKPKGAER